MESVGGKAWDVFIHPRKNKVGKNFSFVKFREVVDPKRLQRQLDNIFIIDMKLYLNIPRFKRRGTMVVEKDEKWFKIDT